VLIGAPHRRANFSYATGYRQVGKSINASARDAAVPLRCHTPSEMYRLLQQREALLAFLRFLISMRPL
jgi:hypothetical protein